MTEKKVFLCTVNCPCCNEEINIGKTVTVLRPAEPAEKEETYFAEKSAQRKLQ